MGLSVRRRMTALRGWPLPDVAGYSWTAGGQGPDHGQKRGQRMDRLKGKVAMVVGAGSVGPGWGNGKATAVTFAREGAQVFCVDRNSAAAEETLNIIRSEGN